MTPERSEGVFDYFAVKLRLSDEPLAYYFEVHGRDRQVCYTKGGVSEQPDEHFLFRICPGFSTPDWAKGAVMYQIFTDRFCNGDPGNDVLDHEYSYGGGHTHRVADWDRLPEPFDVGTNTIRRITALSILTWAGLSLTADRSLRMGIRRIRIRSAISAASRTRGTWKQAMTSSGSCAARSTPAECG